MSAFRIFCTLDTGNTLLPGSRVSGWGSFGLRLGFGASSPAGAASGSPDIGSLKCEVAGEGDRGGVIDGALELGATVCVSSSGMRTSESCSDMFCKESLMDLSKRNGYRGWDEVYVQKDGQAGRLW